MRFRKTLCFLLIIAIMASINVSSFAEVSAPKRNTCVTKYARDLDSNDTILELLNDPNVECVNILFDSYDNNDFSSSNEYAQESAEISPFAFGDPIYTLYIKNVRSGSDYYGTTVLAKAEGEPGITVSISQTKTVSTTLSATFGMEKSAISAKVGWNVSGSKSITISGSYTVPYTYNGKSVKSATLCAKAIYKVKYFDVYRGIQGSSVETLLGTGNTKQAYGVSFYKTYVYK